MWENDAKESNHVLYPVHHIGSKSLAILGYRMITKTGIKLCVQETNRNKRRRENAWSELLLCGTFQEKIGKPKGK